MTSDPKERQAVRAPAKTKRRRGSGTDRAAGWAQMLRARMSVFCPRKEWVVSRGRKDLTSLLRSRCDRPFLKGNYIPTRRGPGWRVKNKNQEAVEKNTESLYVFPSARDGTEKEETGNGKGLYH